jgi:tetratricopeptide (TPR) repeat protein
MMDFDPTRARANVEVRVFVFWRLLSCAMLLVLLSCLGALFSLRARSVFLLSLSFQLEGFLEALLRARFCVDSTSNAPARSGTDATNDAMQQDLSSFADDVEKFVERAKRKDGSLLERKKERGENSTEKPTTTLERKSERDAEETTEKAHFLLREKGNECFKRGKLDEAEKIYTESLNAKETAAVLSNRAMVRLKLGKLKACVKDCARSLDLLAKDDDDDDKSKKEALMVKTYQRKGTAEIQLKMYREAVVSYENALRMKPESEMIREQRKAAVKEMEMEMVVVKDGQVELCAKDFAVNRRENQVLTEKKKELETPSPATMEKRKDVMEKEEEEKEERARRPKETATIMDVEKVRKAISKLNHDDNDIETGPAFDKQWKLAANSSEKKCKILRAVRVENISKILAERLTGDLLGDIVAVILTHWIDSNSSNEEPLNWLTELTKTNRFSMASMLLSGAAKARAAERWNRCVQRLAEDATREVDARTKATSDRLDHLRALFRL